jgi:hypothetical protein
MCVGVAGTSAACPVVAGIFTIVNNARLKAGKKSLGFLNPFIYANSESLPSHSVCMYDSVRISLTLMMDCDHEYSPVLPRCV